MPTGTVSIPGTKLGRRLRELRTDAGLTQQDLARRLNTGANRVCDWELGTHVPQLAVLERIAGTYEMTVAELLAGVM